MEETATHQRLNDLLDGCLLAVEEEIAAVRDQLAARGLDGPVPVSGGRLLDAAGAFLYEWRLPSGHHDVRPDDAVRVLCEAGETSGFVTTSDREARRVRVATTEWLGRLPSVATLEFDPSWLLGSLASRLQAIRAEPERYHTDTILRLFGRSFPEVGRIRPTRPDSGALNRAQQDALERMLGSDVQFVWGPPGTGKTKLLGHAVAEMADQGSVLVASVTNGAVDLAALRVAEVLGPGAVRANRIVRVGAGLSGTGDPTLSLEAALERRLTGGKIVAGVELLEGELGLGPPRGREAMPQRARLRRAQAAARRLDDRDALGRAGQLARDIQVQALLVLREADVVLTTFARLALWEELAALRFDSLVIDEASTAPLPYVALAAARSSGRAVAIGDFQQLPAVVTSRGEAAARWLSRDLFREVGIVTDVPGEVSLPSPQDGLCAMLDEQYRMAPAIRRLVSEFFYDGRLRDAPEVTRRPQVACPLVLVDSADMRPKVVRSEGSRTNAAHIRLILRLLEALASCGMDDVAVVTPYRLQMRKLREAVRDQLGKAAPAGLEIATIHRFQGREKSVLLLDTVDAPPGTSWFLHEGRNPDLPRLINVALSRARHALVLIASVAGLRRTLPADALVNRIVARVAEEGVCVSGADLLRGADPVGLWRPAGWNGEGRAFPINERRHSSHDV